MSLVSSHYVHLLVLRQGKSCTGWYTPYELRDDSLSSCSLAIPLIDGKPVESYWLEVVYSLNETRHTDMHSLVRNDDGGFVLEHPVVALRFNFVDPTFQTNVYRYCGELSHEDFAYPLAAIYSIHESAYDVVLQQMGASLIGCDPFRHYQQADGTPLPD